MARVVVIGPNLPTTDLDYSTFHVHAEGCADIHRSPMYRSREYDTDKRNVIDYPSAIAMVESVYGDHLDEDDDLTPESLLNDFRIFPCVAFDKVRVPGTKVDAYNASLPTPEKESTVKIRFEKYTTVSGFLIVIDMEIPFSEENEASVYAMRNSRNIRIGK